MPKFSLSSDGSKSDFVKFFYCLMERAWLATIHLTEDIPLCVFELTDRKLLFRQKEYVVVFDRKLQAFEWVKKNGTLGCPLSN
jgi:hypothetical protein